MIAASCIRHDGGNDGVTTVAGPKRRTRNWRKGQRVGAVAADRERCRQLDVEEEINGFRRGASPVIPVSVGCSNRSERVSLIVRNDDGVDIDTLRRSLPNDKRK